MPYDEPDPTDPHELVGVVLPAAPDASREMAYAFAEEFARDGWNRERILWMFGNPFYAGAHGAYRVLGHEVVADIVDECLAVWGRVLVMDREAGTPVPPPSTESDGS